MGRESHFGVALGGEGRRLHDQKKFLQNGRVRAAQEAGGMGQGASAVRIMKPWDGGEMVRPGR
ncbi:hypothetical protein Acsp04_15190 [Actinomadura sp. NBRC 104425]|nr:hypothetical protein Acsp04_15190 [Actinomadura sp. NBRC 104425]